MGKIYDKSSHAPYDVTGHKKKLFSHDHTAIEL